MKKIVSGISVIVMLTILIGADIRRNISEDQGNVIKVTKKKCLGYTIIEYGKGVDCNGDTVKLVKINGVQVLASGL